MDLYFTKLSNICHHELSQVLKHPIRIDRLINMTFISVLFFVCFPARLFVDALWSPAGKALTSWISLVMSYCDVVTFPLVCWVRCGA